MLSLVRRFCGALSRWLDQREVSDSAITFVSALVVGIGAGLGAAAFRWLLGTIHSLSFGAWGDAVSSWIPLLVVPALGGLIVGPLIYFWAREASGLARQKGTASPR